MQCIQVLILGAIKFHEQQQNESWSSNPLTAMAPCKIEICKREVSSNLETNRNQVNRLPPTNLLALTARGFQSGSNPKHPRAYSEHPWDLNLRLSSPTDQSLSSEDPSVRHQKPIVSLYAPSHVLNGRDCSGNANYRAPCCGILSFAMSAVLGMRRLQGTWSACKNFVARGISR